MEERQHTYVAAAGTFDRFHSGHKDLIDKAFEIGERVAIGITTHNLHKSKKLHEQIQDLESRKGELMRYLVSKNWLDRASFSTISDIYGPARSDRKLQALVVTRDTYDNAQIVNKARKENGLSEMDIIKVPLVKGEDGQVIRSWRIRKGETDREGRVYARVFGERDLILPRSLRPIMREPFGEARKNITKAQIMSLKPTVLIAVGDVIVMDLIAQGITPDIQFIDHKTQRKDIAGARIIEQKGHKRVNNPPGIVSAGMVKTFQHTLDEYLETGKPQQIVVEGEEDLTALPAMLLSPLDSVVLYGQVGLGLVVVRVTEELKNRVHKILDKFE